jgi:hypothetical protein
MPDWWRRQRPTARTPGIITPRQHHPVPRPPTPAQPAPSTALIGGRHRWQVERLREEARRWSADIQRDPFTADGGRRDDEWERGIIDAASWALGELERAPISRTLTGKGVVPDADLIEDEDDKADWALRHPREAGTTSAYANGVQHTLMWVGGDTDEPPIGFDD